jgi:predicted transcriptional regulator
MKQLALACSRTPVSATACIPGVLVCTAEDSLHKSQRSWPATGRRAVADAAQLMSEHGVSHLVVIDSAGGDPLGVVSTLDIATVYANR